MPVDWNSLDYRVRRQPSVKGYVKALQVAYDLPNQIQVPFPDEDIADAGNFPQNIQEHFWIRSDTVESGAPWMSVGVLSNGNFFYFRGDKENRSTELYVTPSFRSLVDFGLGEKYEIEYPGGSRTPNFPGEIPSKKIPIEYPYMAWISGTLDPEAPVISEWERRISEGKLVCFACAKEFIFKKAGDTMCGKCSEVNALRLAEAREIEAQRAKARAAAAAKA
jgi:hypothetical protein